MKKKIILLLFLITGSFLLMNNNIAAYPILGPPCEIDTIRFDNCEIPKQKVDNSYKDLPIYKDWFSK